MNVKFVKTTNDVIPKPVIGESVLYELTSPFNPDKPLSRYWLQCHECGLVANLGSHDSVEVKDGIVTISPSIDCPKCPAHYWIKQGKIQ